MAVSYPAMIDELLPAIHAARVDPRAALED
jgi:hypothetical protein